MPFDSGRIDMMKNKVLFIFAVIIPVFFLFSCAAGKKEFEIGMTLDSAGKYNESIAYLNQAIEKEPGNKNYRKALSDIKEKLVNRYIGEGAKELGKSPVTISAINNSKAKLDKARGIDPGHRAVKDLEGKIKTQEDNLLTEVKDLYSSAKNEMAGNEWLKAYFNVQQIQSKFPNYEDSVQLASRIRTNGTMAYFDTAKALFDQEKFKESGKYLQKAVSLDAEHSPSRKLMARAGKNDNMDYFIGQAKEAVSSKNWDRAVKSYENALEYAPDNGDLMDIIAHVRTKAGLYYIQKAKSQIDEGWLFRAFKDYALASRYIEDPNDYQTSGARRDLASRAAFAGEYFRDMGQYGSAWFWYKKLEAIEPEYPDIFQLVLSMEDKITLRVKKSIAVFDFDAPSDNRDAGTIVANNLITYLFKNASGDIIILEREKLKSILEEMKLGQIGVISEKSAKEMGRVHGIDVAIMGSVLLFKVDSSSSQSTKSVRYQVGEKIEDNIDYQNWLAKHPKPNKKEIAEAPPAKVKVPQFVERDYIVSNHKKVGFVQISFRIVDVITGETTQVKTIQRKEVAEDEASAGLPEAGIKFDPEEIPMDTELLQKMTGEVVAELGREALKPLQNLEKEYFEIGEGYVRRRDELLAAERFVDAIFDEKLKMVQGSPLTQKATQNLEDVFLNYNIGM